MTPPRAPALLFGPFMLNVAEAQLTREGRPVALRPKAFELLVALARRPRELVTKDELLDAVWGRRFITEGVIKSVVGELRTALGDDPKSPQWIETVPRRGYRFAGQIETVPATAAQPAAAPAVPLASGAGNLPAALPPLIGREAELAELATLLAAQRLLTLAGPSGIGKTSLALALAAAQRPAWPDGVWFVELAALAAETTTAATLCATLAQTLQLDAGAATEAGLGRALQPLALLIVLDNAEHLLAPLAPLVAGLLAQALALRVIVTSQEPLRIAGEQVYRLQPLALPPAADDADAARLMASSAVRLFVDRVAGRLPGFTLAPQQQHAVAGICRALDGLPLALELAAARVPLLGVHGISDMLLGDDASTRLRLLTQGARTAAPRQRTLRDALAWSHDLLDEPQRRVFRRLGVFRGGFTLEAAQTVCADEALDAWAVLDAAHALVEKSLLVLSAGTDAGSPPRFTLLESLRSFALERLAEAGEDEATRQRHSQAVLAGWKRADARALSDPVLPWLVLHRPELDNLRAALRWALAGSDDAARADTAVALVVFAGVLWHRAGLVAEGRAACDAVRAQAERTNDTTLRAGFDLLVATLTTYASAFPNAEALASAQRAAAVFSDGGDTVRAYFASYLVYQLSLRTPPETDRAAVLERMAALVQPGWSELLTRYLRNARGYELRLAGQTEAYLAFCRDELARCRRLGAVAEGWAAAQGLMLAENDAGHLDAALDAGREALQEVRAAGRVRQHGPLLALWTTLLAERGDAVATRAALAEALPALRGAGTPWMLHVALVWLAASEGRVDAAARLLGWRDARQRARTEGESGATIQRALQRLGERLDQQLGAAAITALHHEGAALDDAAAERLALGA
ncbi:MAG: winged helix-turn-helix domain-containing protein [Burkholderiaceae bacterium]